MVLLQLALDTQIEDFNKLDFLITKIRPTPYSSFDKNNIIILRSIVKNNYYTYLPYVPVNLQFFFYYYLFVIH